MKDPDRFDEDGQGCPLLRNEIGTVIMQECEHAGHNLATVPHQHMATCVITNELDMWDMVCDELCVHVGTIEVIFGADRKRRRGDQFQGLRKVFNGQLSL